MEIRLRGRVRCSAEWHFLKAQVEASEGHVHEDLRWRRMGLLRSQLRPEALNDRFYPAPSAPPAPTPTRLARRTGGAGGRVAGRADRGGAACGRSELAAPGVHPGAHRLD